jgi:hypothetical protein
MQLKTTKSKNNDCGTAPGNLVFYIIGFLHIMVYLRIHLPERLACAVTELRVHIYGRFFCKALSQS